jgi:hypothetical protein
MKVTSQQETQLKFALSIGASAILVSPVVTMAINDIGGNLFMTRVNSAKVKPVRYTPNNDAYRAAHFGLMTKKAYDEVRAKYVGSEDWVAIEAALYDESVVVYELPYSLGVDAVTPYIASLEQSGFKDVKLPFTDYDSLIRGVDYVVWAGKSAINADVVVTVRVQRVSITADEYQAHFACEC